MHGSAIINMTLKEPNNNRTYILILYFYNKLPQRCSELEYLPRSYHQVSISEVQQRGHLITLRHLGPKKMHEV